MRSWTRMGLVGVALFALSGTVGRTARAQSAGDKAAAEALFDEAKRLMAEKKWALACPKLADSQRLDPGVGTLLNLALCFKENGQTASAWTTYREAAAQARVANQTDRETHARGEAAALEKRLTRLLIDVSPQVTSLPGLVIKRDGAVVPGGLFGIAAPVDPGIRVIDVTASGKKPVHLEVKAEGAGITTKISILPMQDALPGEAPAPAPDAAPPAATMPAATTPAPPDAAPPVAPTSPPPGTGEAKPGNGQRIAGYVVGGVGVLGLATGTWFGLLSNAQSQAADKAEQNGENNPDRADYYEDRRRMFSKDADGSRTIAFVALGAGAACVVGGIVLIVTAPKAGEKKAELELLPELGQDQLGLRLSGTF
jgi:serine/threonine-protein kinase